MTRVDERLLEVYERAEHPDDPLALRDLFVGRIAMELGESDPRADLWRHSRRRRQMDPADVLVSRATPSFVKALFNWFFQHDLYGVLRSDENIILSGGSADEEIFGLPATLKQCIVYALERDWYGYSDSCGREASREAVSEYESARIQGHAYSRKNVALTMGGTASVSAVADFVALRSGAGDSPALCGLPNYPPLVEAIARRGPVELVPVDYGSDERSLEPLIERLRPHTPLVLLQTVTNPSGVGVAEAELARLIERASPSTVIVLDECHECLGPTTRIGKARASRNVVRLASLSKGLSAPGLKVGWLVADEQFISDYYEYASTSYGSPASVFYLLVEVMARMLVWLGEGLEAVGSSHVSQFEESYGLTAASLNEAYRRFREDHLARRDLIIARREHAVELARSAGLEVIRPSHSINVAVRFPGGADNYRTFREVLAATGVALFPGVLSYCFDPGWMRVSPAINEVLLTEAFARLGTLRDRRSGAS